MRVSSKLVYGGLAALAVVLAGCEGCTNGGGNQLKKVNGEPRFVTTNPDTGEETLVQDQLVLDFGPALLNSRIEKTIVLRNDGRAAFEVNTADRADGFQDNFRFQFEPFALDVGEQRELSVFFEPTQEGDHESDLVLNVDSGSVPSMLVHVKGRGVKGGCGIDPAPQADFGSVATGTSYVMPVVIHNNSDLEWKVSIGKITSQSDDGAFAFSNFQPGDYTVPAHEAIQVPIEFRPNHPGQHSAFLNIPGPSMCQPNVLPLVGNGVDQVLTWEPNIVNFGFVNPGTKVLSKVTFKNLGNQDVTVTNLTVVNPPLKDQFALEGAATYIVPKGGGAVEVPLSFKPTLLGAQSAKLNFVSDDKKLTSGAITLSGYGGGPNIAVSPLKVDFGQVALNTWQFRRINIANTGSDAPGTTDDNLLLALPKPAGGWAQKYPTISGDPDFELEFKGTADEGKPQGYLAAGVPANDSVDLRVKFTPSSPGPKTAKVTIYSNDPDQPTVEVQIVAGGKQMPPCDYDILPPKLAFGVIESGKNMTLPFTIKNRSSNPADECLISTMEFSKGTSTVAYSFPAAPPANYTIKGGDSLQVPVKFAPKSDGTYNGQVEFYISSQTAPEGKVTLQGLAQQGCLLVAPNDLDFGVIQVNCNSRARTFTVYNVCSSTVTLTGIDVQAGASNEFRISKKPALSYPLAAGASVDFEATYKPTDEIPDTGSIAVQTLQLSQPYVVTIAGKGAQIAIQTDVFAQDPQPKVDVLIVVDDSCSMYNKQTSLAANFASFIKFAVNQQVDYHIGVTTTSMCSNPTSCTTYESKGSGIPYASGRLVAENGNPLGTGPKVITPNTTNKETAFSNNVKVGTTGDGSEELLAPAYYGLSSAWLNGPNKDFYRDEAHLAIIIVSDAADQSSNTVAFYQSFFLNLKGSRRTNMMSVSGIIPTGTNGPPAGSQSGCDYDDSSAGQSTRVKQIITQTGGFYDDICTPNWAKTLEKLGQTAFGYRTRFFLSNIPDLTITPTAIEVKVDGNPYPETGTAGDTRWSYNPTVNAIDFEPLAVPEPGSTLTITYHVQCIP